MNDPGNAREIIQFCKEHLGAEAQAVTAPIEGLPKNVPFLLVPQGLKVQSLKALVDEWRVTPERVKGTATLQTVDSLIEHTNRFKGESSAVFCDWQTPSLQVVMDYHQADAGDRARWCQHRARYDFPLSDEWKAWCEINGQELSQGDFAEFIEDHLVDVCDPEKAGETARGLMQALELTLASPSKVLALSRGLSLRENTQVAQQVSLPTGEVQFTFQSEHTDQAGQKVNVPRAFLIGIPVFLGRQVGYPIAIRLRYRLNGNKLTWIMKMHQETKYLLDAVQEDASRVAAETGLPLYWGAPEK